MKTIPIALASEYAKPGTSIATCLKVTRADGLVLGFTDIDVSLTVFGLAYIPGFEVSSLASTESLGVDNMELTIVPDDDLPATDLLAGLWNNATFEIFEVNYEAPGDGINILKRGTTGEVQLSRGKYVIEFRSNNQALQQTQGIVTSKTCRARLGDDKCRKDLTSFTFTGALTAGGSPQVLTDSGRAEADNYFAEGIITMTSGPAVGMTQKVRAFSSGVFTLSLPLPYTPLVGNTYSVIAGCRKRLTEDCLTKFNNVLNFQGEPHLPNIDLLTSPAAHTA